ncbi:MAG TPA: long-chain fatty acid--CoA ligase [Pseudonocardiaceae bacterium]|nr:long-chain fatty acid--CoA ligase [Pseudonocardiaceae bacterium]
MREFSVPAIATVGDEENLTDVVWANAERFASSISFRRRTDGGWVDVTAQDFATQVSAVAKGLIAAGVQRGDRVAILSKTRYEWTLVDYAIWAAGGSTVPIYETSSAEQVEWILADSGAKAVVVETAAHRETVRGLADLPELADVWQIEAPDGPGGAAAAIDELTALGASVSDDAVRERARSVPADDLATLIYTSGTTGRPKGCELTHRNLLADVRAAVAAFPQLMQASNSVLLFLPLAHVLARIVQCASVYARITLGHTSDVKNLLTDLAEFRPTFVLAVPRVLEKVYNGAKQKAHTGGKGRIFDAAEATAVAWSRAQDTGGPSLALRAKHALFARLVYAKLRAALGGRCIAALSGGAPLGERLGHFFRGVGLPVFEGYGLTETSGAATVNTESEFKIGTVGRPVAGVTVRLEPDGEILLKGDVIFRRYWKNEAATGEVLTDGWFHTGDVGELDDEGFLRITGRTKEIIVTAGGKNVAPAQLEDRIRAHPLISQCMVVGDRQPFIGALVTIDPEALPAWRSEHAKPESASVADLTDDADLRAEVQAAVDDANRSVSHVEGIKEFRILPVDFTEDTGELTPTLKLKRSVVEKSFSGEIDAIYSR